MKRFITTSGGAYYAVGRGSAITGRGADLFLIDDPLKDAEEARSENVRHALQEWYQNVAYTRLQPGGALVLIQTRWHFDDLAGWLLCEHPEENWDVLNLPAIAEADGDGRREGEPLWPSKFSAEILAAIKTGVGGATWAALYQQRPAAAEGEVFKREWWKATLRFRSSAASSNRGTPLSKPAPRTITAYAPLGVRRKTASTCYTCGAAGASFRN